MNDTPAQQPAPLLLTTEELSALLRDAPTTIRKNHCLQGHHHGLRPLKMPNGRLLWRHEDALALINGGAK